MKNEILMSLLAATEKQIVGIWIARDLVKLKDLNSVYSCSNIQLTELGITMLSKLVMDVQAPEEEFVTKFRNYWPPGYRSTKKEIDAKLKLFMSKNLTISEDQILEAAREHNHVNQAPFCGKAGLFIYKRTYPGNLTISKLESYLDKQESEVSWGEDI